MLSTATALSVHETNSKVFAKILQTVFYPEGAEERYLGGRTPESDGAVCRTRQ